MKRILLLIAGVVVALGAVAQNANRSGFVVEAGVGGFVGKTPRTSVTATNDHKIIVTFANGCALDLAVAYRLRLSTHWAYEWRLGLEAAANHFNPFFNPKIFPVGFRYTSKEVYRNNSIYASLNLGISSWPRGTYPTEYPYGGKELEPGEHKNFGASMADFGDIIKGVYGVVYSVGLGVNITPKLWVGVTWDAQFNFTTYHSLYREREFEHLYWGSIGARVGYRF